MPLQKSYKEGLKSHIADMKNTGPRAGGSITAALFLEEFFDKEIKWAHIDIAGTCWTCLLYTSPSPRDGNVSRMPSSA